jgi:hypothetical protein
MLMYKTDCYEMHALSGGGRTVEAKNDRKTSVNRA